MTDDKRIIEVSIVRSGTKSNGYRMYLPALPLDMCLLLDNNSEVAYEYEEGRLVLREVSIDDIDNIVDVLSISNYKYDYSVSFRIPTQEDIITIGSYPIDEDESDEYNIIVYCTDEDRIIK